MIYQCVACNARFLVISLRETTINDHQLAVGLYRILAISHVYGYMPVDDVPIFALNIEGIKNAVNHRLVVSQRKIVALSLLMCFFFGDEITFEGGHF